MSYPVPIPMQKKSGYYIFFYNESTAVGEESFSLSRECEDYKKHFLNPISRQWSDLETRFMKLKNQWEEETAALSSITDIAMHPAYQQIIGMGTSVIPFIIREMTINPNHWFWALKSITGEDPVPPEKRGKVKDMTNTWIFWWILYQFQL